MHECHGGWTRPKPDEVAGRAELAAQLSGAVEGRPPPPPQLSPPASSLPGPQAETYSGERGERVRRSSFHTRCARHHLPDWSLPQLLLPDTLGKAGVLSLRLTGCAWLGSERCGGGAAQTRRSAARKRGRPLAGGPAPAPVLATGTAAAAPCAGNGGGRRTPPTATYRTRSPTAARSSCPPTVTRMGRARTMLRTAPPPPPRPGAAALHRVSRPPCLRRDEHSLRSDRHTGMTLHGVPSVEMCTACPSQRGAVACMTCFRPLHSTLHRLQLPLASSLHSGAAVRRALNAVPFMAGNVHERAGARVGAGRPGSAAGRGDTTSTATSRRHSPPAIPRAALQLQRPAPCPPHRARPRVTAPHCLHRPVRPKLPVGTWQTPALACRQHVARPGGERQPCASISG